MLNEILKCCFTCSNILFDSTKVKVQGFWKFELYIWSFLLAAVGGKINKWLQLFLFLVRALLTFVAWSPPHTEIYFLITRAEEKHQSLCLHTNRSTFLRSKSNHYKVSELNHYLLSIPVLKKGCGLLIEGTDLKYKSEILKAENNVKDRPTTVPFTQIKNS